MRAGKPTVQVQIWIDAPPQRVWALVSEVEPQVQRT